MVELKDLQNLEKRIDDKLEVKFSEFATLVNVGFQAVQQQFGEMQRQQAETDQKVELRFQAVQLQIRELDEQHKATDRKIDKLYTAIDGFMALHQKLSQELVMLSAKVQRLEDRLQQLEQRYA